VTLRACALVTGATSGSGRTVGGQLAGHGAAVIVHGRDAARASEVVDAIAAEGGKARFVAADLTQPAELDGLAERADQVDVLSQQRRDSPVWADRRTRRSDLRPAFTANVQPVYFLTAALTPDGGHGQRQYHQCRKMAG
jgi:NAD(P)-dependent dehydrogenase (short-subunit alcohol dehydrogenase family)